MTASPAAAGVLAPLDSPPRWCDELPLAARVVLALDDLVSEWHEVFLTLLVGTGAVAAAPDVTRLFDPTASAASLSYSIVYAALFVAVPALGACAFFLIPRAYDRADLRRNDEELRAGLWQLGVLSPSLFMKRHPRRVQAFHEFDHAVYRATGHRQGTRRAAFGVSLLAFAIEDPGALDRIIGVVAERGPLAPNEIVRLAVAGKDCRPLSRGAL